jgi:Helix-turn-helix domain
MKITDPGRVPSGSDGPRPIKYGSGIVTVVAGTPMSDACTRNDMNRRTMADKPIAFVEIRKQRLFGPKAAARYLGVCEDTLKKMSDLGQIRAFNMNGRRAYRLEDLDTYVESLPEWYDSTGEKSAKVVSEGESHDL